MDRDKNQQSLQRTFHRCYLPNFSSFGKEVSEEKIFQKSTNQKQELSVVAMFVNGSGQNEQSLQRTFHRCFLPTGLDINFCPIPVETDVGQVDLVLRCPMGQVKKSEIPKRAGTTDKSISTGIKYWVCCIKEHCLISNLSIIYFD